MIAMSIFKKKMIKNAEKVLCSYELRPLQFKQTSETY